MVIENAAPYFKLISKSSGRLDYIETITQWEKRYRAFHPKKYALYLSLIPRYLTNSDFRALFSTSPNKICFQRELFDHFRIVFEKVG